jgi:hypothetical protein
MVQKFQERLMKIYSIHSKQYSKILDDYTTEFDQILCLNLEYLETTKLMTELDTKHVKKFNLT